MDTMKKSPDVISNYWLSEIDEITRLFCTQFGELTYDTINWKPHAKSWSVAQNIEHLIIINESYFPIFEEVITGNYRRPLLGKFGFYRKFCSKMILNSVQPDRRKKIKTFPIWEPSHGDIPGDILNRFVIHQDELKHKIMALKDHLNRNIVISSPANKYIVYNLETALDIIVAHEKRHFEQALEVLNKINNEKV